VAFWRFDDDGAVLKYDAWIPNLNAWIEASTGIPISNSQLEGGTIQQVCAVTQQRCTGSNTQWSSVAQCVSVLSQKPYGNYDETWGDNIVCRTIHLVLTQVRPEVSSLTSSACFAPQQTLNCAKYRSIAPTWDLQEAASVWTLHMLKSTLATRPFMVIREERRSGVLETGLLKISKT
jgi:hypothetical protein